jgi:type IV pilus assembly protein PilE
MNKHHLSGVTLIELMIVVVIVAIVAAIAYPSYQNQIMRTRRADGQAKLMEIMSAQERWYSARNSYTATLTDLGYAASEPSTEGWYLITAAACPGNTIANCVLLTATPQGGQAGDGPLTLNSRNQRTGNW